MPHFQQILCTFEIEGVSYGPATCELVEKWDVEVPGNQKLSWEATFLMEPEADSLPLNVGDALLHLEDGRWGNVLITGHTNGRKGKFKVQGDLNS